MRFTQLLLSLLPLVPCALSGRVSARDTTNFKLYAYGTNIGGLPVFYYQGAAYIGDSSSLTDAVGVSFNNNGGTFTAIPDNSTSAFSNSTFYVPSPSAGGGPSGFLNGTSSNDTSSVTSTGWSFYGSVAILELADGSWVTSFYAGPSSFTNIYSLEWNVTDTSTAIPVTIKTTAPSNPSS